MVVVVVPICCVTSGCWVIPLALVAFVLVWTFLKIAGDFLLEAKTKALLKCGSGVVTKLTLTLAL